MDGHLKLFQYLSQYEDFKKSPDYLNPNVSWVLENDKVYYNYTPINNGNNGQVKPYESEYLTFVAVEDSSILLSGMNIATGEPVNTIDLQYSKDGSTWMQYEFNPIPLNAGETLYMKGNNSNGFSIMDMDTGVGAVYTFSDILENGNGTTGKYECHGNIMSLIYGDDFEDKTTIPSVGCFYNLFYMCVGLLTAPELPATTLTEGCYSSMFDGCTSLVTAPELPATTLATSCYSTMFYGCSSLTTAPELPATTLMDGCYNTMFDGCTSLVTAPKLPATTLVDGCYSSMFSGCTLLTTAPELPAITLADNCYNSMFWGCTSLTTAPELPATTLANSCYFNMFGYCTSLVNAPKLPATTLSENCYFDMFGDCTSLVTAPELPATTLADKCYDRMFDGCTSLNQITMLATDVSATDCLREWVSDVASSGTFVKHPNMNSLPTGTSGIPSGWTVVNYEEI